MFTELFDPVPVDVLHAGAATSDPGQHRVKLRIAERGAHGRYWLSLSFRNDIEMQAFVDALQKTIDRPREAASSSSLIRPPK